MKKKFLGLTLSLLMAVVCFFGLSACNNGELLSKADYAKVLNSAITTVSNYGTTTNPLRASLNDEDFQIIQDQQQGKNVLEGNTAMLYFLRNLCNTDTFEIKEDYVDMIVNDNVSNSELYQIFKIRLKMSYDKNTSIIKSTVYVEDYTDTNISVYLLEFEFNYDFDTQKLNGFSVLGVMGDKDNLTTENVRYIKYYNNVLQISDTTATNFETFANDILSEMAVVGEKAFEENLPDYSTQYIEGMQEAFAN